MSVTPDVNSLSRSSGNDIAEFLVAGHSHYFAMGAPQGYKGQRQLLETLVCDRRGYFVMEQDSEPRSDQYWSLLVESSTERDVIISWNGNQHIASFLFELVPPIDFLDENVSGGRDIESCAAIVPRRLIKAHFKSTITPLEQLLRQLITRRPKSVTIVGTPPPRRSLADIEHRIMLAPYWRQVAERCGVDLQSAQLSSPRLLLKLWAVIQEMLFDAATTNGARFIPVPSSLRDQYGFLLEKCGVGTDFTHANDLFGKTMLSLALSRG